MCTGGVGLVALPASLAAGRPVALATMQTMADGVAVAASSAHILAYVQALEPAAYRAHSSAVASAFAQWPGPLRKIWLADGSDGRLGGIYVFTDQAAADASRDTDPFRGMTTNPHFTDLKVEEFDVFDDLTVITTQESVA